MRPILPRTSGVSVGVATRALLSTLPAGGYAAGQVAWVADIGVGYGAHYLFAPEIGTADGYFLITASGAPGYQWVLRGQSVAPFSQRLTFWSDEIDFLTVGNYPLRGVPDTATGRFLFISGRVILMQHTGGSYGGGPLVLNPGLSVAGVLTYRFASSLSITAATINTYTAVPNPGSASNFSTISATPWQALDLTGLAATPVVNVSGAITGGSPLTGRCVFDGCLVGP